MRRKERETGCFQARGRIKIKYQTSRLRSRSRVQNSLLSNSVVVSLSFEGETLNVITLFDAKFSCFALPPTRYHTIVSLSFDDRNLILIHSLEQIFVCHFRNGWASQLLLENTPFIFFCCSRKPPVCNRSSGIYVLTGFSGKKRHRVGKFSTRLLLSVRSLFCPYSNYICWVCLSRTGEVTN